MLSLEYKSCFLLKLRVTSTTTIVLGAEKSSTNTICVKHLEVVSKRLL